MSTELDVGVRKRSVILTATVDASDVNDEVEALDDAVMARSGAVCRAVRLSFGACNAKGANVRMQMTCG